MRRPTPAYAGAIEEGRPIAELNMTPLIDVLLVLIVMFIMVIPVMTNEVPVVLPAPGAGAPVTTHRLTVARDGAVALDGVRVDDAGLGARLGAVGREERATLVMRTDPSARYARFLQVLAVVKRAGVTRLGFERP